MKKSRTVALLFFLLALLMVVGCGKKDEDDPVVYRITFDTNGGSAVVPLDTDGTLPLDLPDYPIRDGFVFAGWFKDDGVFTLPFTAQTPVSGNLTVYAKWDPVLYTLTFETNGGSSVGQILTDGKSTISLPDDPVREGYVFSGWFLDDVTFALLFLQNTLVNNPRTSDLTVFAKWVREGFTLTFDTVGGSSVSPFVGEQGQTIVLPADPVKDGHTFAGWYLDLTYLVPLGLDTMPDSDFTVYAKWLTDVHTISFESNGGTEVDPIVREAGQWLPVPDTPVKTGHDFLGWFSDPQFENRFYFNVMPGYDLTLHASWERLSYTFETYDLGESVKDVSSGNFHTLVLTERNRLFAVGYNVNGQLGDGTTTNRTTPVDITDMLMLASHETVKDIFTGDTVSFVLTSENRLLVFGGSYLSTLQDQTSVPTDITDVFSLDENERIIHLFVGTSHAILTTSSGRVFGWGDSYYGERGDGSSGMFSYEENPIEITSYFSLSYGERIVKAAGGRDHSLYLSNFGKVYGSGNTVHGELGYETWMDAKTPENITLLFGLMEGETVADIQASYMTSVILTSNGRILTTGYNGSGEIGDGSVQDAHAPVDITHHFGLDAGERIISISMHIGEHVIALTSHGRVFTWGRNNDGQLGNGTSGILASARAPQDITSHFGLDEGRTIVSVHASGSHTFAITDDLELYSWGGNPYGRLGNDNASGWIAPRMVTIGIRLIESRSVLYGDTVETDSPIHGDDVFVGWFTDMGRQDAAPVTFDMPDHTVTYYTRYNPLYHAITYHLGGGTNHTLNPERYSVYDILIVLENPVRDGHRFEGWYDNPDFTGMPVTSIEGSTGADLVLYAKWGDPAFMIAYVDRDTALTITTGYDHTMILSHYNALMTFGDNSFGQLGGGHLNQQWTPVSVSGPSGLEDDPYVDVSGGWGHTVALTASGHVHVWGMNTFNQLGDPSLPEMVSMPTDITHRFSLIPGETVIDVIAGGHHTFATTSEGRLFVWGSNWEGVFGNGTTTHSNVPLDVTSSLGLAPGETVLTIATKGWHVYILTSENRLLSFGKNDLGQIGDGTSENRLSPVEITDRFGLAPGDMIVLVRAGYENGMALTSSGRLFSWGWNGYGQIGDGTDTNRHLPTEITARLNLDSGDTVADFAIGNAHVLIMSSNGKVYSIGANTGGQIGIPGQPIGEHIYAPYPITSSFMLADGERIVAIAAGGDHSVVLTNAGNVFTFGSNAYNQLAVSGATYLRSPRMITHDLPLERVTIATDMIAPGDVAGDMVLPDRNGLLFDGWTWDAEGDEPFVDGVMPSHDLILYAQWVLGT